MFTTVMTCDKGQLITLLLGSISTPGNASCPEVWFDVNTATSVCFCLSLNGVSFSMLLLSMCSCYI